MAEIKRWASAAAIAILLFVVFFLTYAISQGAIVLVMSLLHGLVDGLGPNRFDAGFGDGPITLSARIMAAIFAPAVAISVVRAIGRRLRSDSYRVPLMVLLILFGLVGAFNQPDERGWVDTAVVALQGAIIIGVALSLMPQRMATRLLKPILLPLSNMLLRERR